MSEVPIPVKAQTQLRALNAAARQAEMIFQAYVQALFDALELDAKEWQIAPGGERFIPAKPAKTQEE